MSIQWTSDDVNSVQVELRVSLLQKKCSSESHRTNQTLVILEKIRDCCVAGQIVSA